ncbi:hypothetical protein F5Y15DRAFT_418656 [Xylariaceae sp. FL0016]|nr:hypothetical protein F5Y15DRAFT_418656 [Xylariaceae sp. FL0016]
MAGHAPGVEPIRGDHPCYNCGMTGHLFTACPEPVRPRPAGLERSQYRQNASSSPDGAFGKRGKGPVITRYPLPPTPGQAMGHPDRSPGPSYIPGLPPGFPPQSPFAHPYGSHNPSPPNVQHDRSGRHAPPGPPPGHFPPHQPPLRAPYDYPYGPPGSQGPPGAAAYGPPPTPSSGPYTAMYGPPYGHPQGPPPGPPTHGHPSRPQYSSVHSPSPGPPAHYFPPAQPYPPPPFYGHQGPPPPGYYPPSYGHPHDGPPPPSVSYDYPPISRSKGHEYPPPGRTVAHEYPPPERPDIRDYPFPERPNRHFPETTETTETSAGTEKTETFVNLETAETNEIGADAELVRTEGRHIDDENLDHPPQHSVLRDELHHNESYEERYHEPEPPFRVPNEEKLSNLPEEFVGGRIANENPSTHDHNSPDHYSPPKLATQTPSHEHKYRAASPVLQSGSPHDVEPGEIKSDIHSDSDHDTESTSDAVNGKNPYKGFSWDMRTIFNEYSGPNADPIAGPLPSEYTEQVMVPPAYDATGLKSEYITADNDDDFASAVRDSKEWQVWQYHPLFRQVGEIQPSCLKEYAKAREGYKNRQDHQHNSQNRRQKGERQHQEHSRNLQKGNHQRGHQHREYPKGDRDYQNHDPKHHRQDFYELKRGMQEPGYEYDARPLPTKRHWQDTQSHPDVLEGTQYTPNFQFGTPGPKRLKAASPEPGELVEDGQRAQQATLKVMEVFGRDRHANEAEPRLFRYNRDLGQISDEIRQPLAYTDFPKTYKRVPNLQIDTSQENTPQPLPPPLSSRSHHNKRELLGLLPGSSSGSDAGGASPKRHIDDVTPGFRRRQPKIDSVYSRRW